MLQLKSGSRSESSKQLEILFKNDCGLATPYNNANLREK